MRVFGRTSTCPGTVDPSVINLAGSGFVCPARNRKVSKLSAVDVERVGRIVTSEAFKEGIFVQTRTHGVGARSGAVAEEWQGWIEE